MSRFATSTRVAIAVTILLSVVAILFSIWPKPIAFSENVSLSDRLETHPSSFTLAGGGELVINEVDSDQASTDTAEFVELYDGGVGNAPLDGYVIVFFNGGATNDASYAAFDLDGMTTNAGGYFTLGNAAVPGVDMTFANGALQNGPDAVALFLGNAANFPNGTPITIANIQDALVYSNAATVDAGLAVLLNAGQNQVNENGLATGTTVSMQRVPNGTGGGRNTDTYALLAPTPDGPNFGPTAAAISLSGRVTDTSGRGIRNASIMLEGGGMPEPRWAAAGSFGQYRFDGMLPGLYMVTVSSQRHSFSMPSRTITMNDSVADIDFVADPQE